MRRFGLIFVCSALAAVVAGLGGYLLVSMLVEQAPEVTVPDVTGLGLSEALDKLNGQGLDLEVRAFVYSDEVPENHVVRQKPEAGRVVRAIRGVGLVLSRGSERHPVPDVRGLSLEDARIQIEEAELQAQVALRVHSGPEGEVVAQGEEPGRRLAKGGTVTLVVSSGPRPVLLRMPRLEGQTLKDAVSQVNSLGLRATRIEEVSLEDPSRHGRVVGQDPAAGFPIPRGGEVMISVAAASRRKDPLRDLWVHRTLPLGFAQHRVEVRVQRGESIWVLADQWLGGGEQFRLFVPLRPDERARVLVDGEEVETLGGR